MQLTRVLAGKFRRYANFGVLDYLKHPSITLANIRDLFKVAAGFLQAKFLMLTWRPDVVFVKGGFVGLPVGLAAGKRPLVIHDSDTVPGLTNRILSRKATKIATGMPLQNYHYDTKRSVYTGIPVDGSLKPVSTKQQAEAKAKFSFDPKRKLVVITGGGLGARRLDDAVTEQREQLLKFTQVALLAGKDQATNFDHTQQSTDFKIYDFLTDDFKDMIAAADVVVSRAGATAIAEFAALAKPVILVPNAMLPGSHQVKNANALAAADAVKVVVDSDLVGKPELLTTAIKEVLTDSNLSKQLATNIHQFAKPNAAKDLAKMILNE